jgi:hypothetical protein
MIATVIAVALFLGVTQSASPAVSADDDDDSVFGVVVKAVDGDTLVLATGKGVKHVKINSASRLDREGKLIRLADVVPGEQAAVAMQRQKGGGRTASKVKFHPGASTPPTVQHVTGVVVKSDDGEITVASKDGRQTTVDIPRGAKSPGISEAVTVVARSNGDRLEARYVERVEETVKRFEVALSREFDQARKALLKQLVKEGSEAHLDALNAALARIHDEARAQVEEAFRQFRLSYSQLAEEIGVETPQVTTGGEVVEVTGDQIVVLPDGGSQPETFTIAPGETVVSADGATVEVSDITPGQQVTIEAAAASDGVIAETPTASTIAIAQPSEATPETATPAAGDTGGADAAVSGTIVSVDLAPGIAGSEAVVMVTDTATGAQSAAVIEETTVVTINGAPSDVSQLEPGQATEIQLAPDGVTAEAVVANDPQPAAPADSSPAGPTATPAGGGTSSGSGQEQLILQGTITATEGGTWVISSVTIGAQTVAVEGDAQPGKSVKIYERTNADGSKSIVAVVTGP